MVRKLRSAARIINSRALLVAGSVGLRGCCCCRAGFENDWKFLFMTRQEEMKKQTREWKLKFMTSSNAQHSTINTLSFFISEYFVRSRICFGWRGGRGWCGVVWQRSKFRRNVSWPPVARKKAGAETRGWEFCYSLNSILVMFVRTFWKVDRWGNTRRGSTQESELTFDDIYYNHNKNMKRNDNIQSDGKTEKWTQ